MGWQRRRVARELALLSRRDEERPRVLRATGLSADLYVDDAFGAAHRAHATTVGVAERLPAAAGLLLEEEVDYLDGVLKDPERPFVAILGGAKVSDKLGVIESLLGVADTLLVGGAMCFTFFKAQGYEVGSLVEDDYLEEAKRLMDEAGEKLVLPVDVVVADEMEEGAEAEVVRVDEIPPDKMGLDIGPRTVELFEEHIWPREPYSGTARWGYSR